MVDEIECSIDDEGTKCWRRISDDEIHGLDGPAIEYKNGDTMWIKDGVEHREDGPAIEYKNGEKHWFINGERHRLDGPACVYPDMVSSWHINGHRVTAQITKWATDNDIDLDNLSEDDKLLIKIGWADYGQ